MFANISRGRGSGITPSNHARGDNSLGTPRLKGAFIPIVAMTRGFPSDPVWLVPNPETVPMMSDGSLLRSGGETWGPVSPDNVHERGVSLDRGRQGGAVRANARKDLVKLAIRGFCALHASMPPILLGEVIERGIQNRPRGSSVGAGRRRGAHQGGKECLTRSLSSSTTKTALRSTD